jgi:hypothetical protein
MSTLTSCKFHRNLANNLTSSNMHQNPLQLSQNKQLKPNTLQTIHGMALTDEE